MDGIWRSAALRKRIPQGQLDRSVAQGTLTRPAWGWYARSGVDHRIVAALRGHTRVGCLTGADLHGLWVPPHHETHVIRPETWHRRRLPDGYLVHTGQVDYREPLCPLIDCLAQIVAHHDPETALIVLESAADQHALPRSDLRDLIASAPARSRRALRYFSDRSQSGGETKVRLFLHLRGARVRAQVQIVGVGRVDLLVGERLIIEVDSRQHHATVEQYHQDRHRDLMASRLGYQTIRLTWEQVFLDWAATADHVSLLLQRREHMTPAHPGTEALMPSMHPQVWLAS